MTKRRPKFISTNSMLCYLDYELRKQMMATVLTTDFSKMKSTIHVDNGQAKTVYGQKLVNK